MQLFTQQELQVFAVLFSRTPMSQPEQVCAQMLLTRLVQFCTPPETPVDAGPPKDKEGK